MFKQNSNSEIEVIVKFYLKNNDYPYSDHYVRLSSIGSNFHKEITSFILENNGFRKIVHSSFEIAEIEIEGKNEKVLCHNLKLRRDSISAEILENTVLSLLSIYKKYSLEMIDLISSDKDVYHYTHRCQ